MASQLQGWINLRPCGLIAQALACAFLLSACASMDIEDTASIPDAPHETAYDSVPKSHARVVVPAEAGAVVAVAERRQRETRDLSTVSQRLILMGDMRTTGENAVEITFKSASNLDDFHDLTGDEVSAALQDQFPNHPMAVSQRVIGNGLGPYVVAVGALNGENCVLAWQRVKQKPTDAAAGKLSIIDMRIRICRTDRSVEQIVATLPRFIVIQSTGGEQVEASEPSGSSTKVASTAARRS
jgi:hypothetical protein